MCSCINSSMSSFQGTRTPIVRTPGSVNGFASGNLVRGCNSPLWQLKKSFFLLDLEFVIICTSSNMLVSCSFMSFLGTL